MKELPILFSSPMVRAILPDIKTNTRRICKATTQNQADIIAHAIMQDMMEDDNQGTHEREAWERIGCPYGQPGDRLWVRETWQALKDDGIGYILTKPSPGCEIRYRATDEPGWIPPLPWRPSIFMPRWASRITLEITSVRVERLQDISEQDALAEGIRKVRVGAHEEAYEWSPQEDCEDTAVAAFRKLWESINGPDSWNQNPYVWVITFRRI